MATIGTLERVTAASLSKILLAAQEAPAAAPNIAIIDVRDDDYIGGHIKGSRNVPSRTLDYMLPTLVRQLQDKDTVVFHCALSQQRGPSAALRYIRERERLLGAAAAAANKSANPTTAAPSSSLDATGSSAGETSNAAADGTAVTAAAATESGIQPVVKEQKVLVLDRGFVGWQEEFGTDERLTEGYRKELWEDGYWG
ncbi:hypothetical protein VTJ49DRAFT_809 [Mycothermus thermophilus]|uniref:Rhodanese domain-containing protein n=1 Tax=Humicola insolens TaxID=85995 RepID=A0ABR3VE02_HUMIN